MKTDGPGRAPACPSSSSSINNVISVCVALLLLLQGCGHSGPAPAPQSAKVKSCLAFDLFAGDFVPGSCSTQLDAASGFGSTSFASSSYIAFSVDRVESDLASKFGVSIGGQKGAFSGSASFQQQRESLETSGTLKVQGEMYCEIIERVLEITPQDVLSLRPGLADAIVGLPNGTDDLTPWVAFFNGYGTEFIRKQYLGGRLHLNFAAQVRTSDLSDNFKRGFRLGAQGTFEDLIKLPLPMKTNCSQEAKHTFQSSAFYQSKTVIAIGGDPTLGGDFDAWKRTLEGRPAAVRQEYAPLHKLLPVVGAQQAWSLQEIGHRAQTMTEARSRFLQLCPKGCSGHGFCDQSNQQCSCDQSYKGDDCSQIVCPVDCGAHGSCDTSTGQCTCEAGWKTMDPTAPCSQDCRIKQYVGDLSDRNCQGILPNPRYKQSGVPTSIGTCLNQCSADRWGCQCGLPAADKYCQIMMKDVGATSLDLTVGDPVCAWDFLEDCYAYEPWSIGESMWHIGIGACTKLGVEPAHPDVFTAVTCKPQCATSMQRQRPAVVVRVKHNANDHVSRIEREGRNQTNPLLF